MPDARPSFADICKQLKATTPKRPSSTSEIRPWSSPRASDEQRQGSMRSMFARALSNFRSTSSLDVGGDKDDNYYTATAHEAPAPPAAAGRASPIEEGAATGKIRVLYEPMRTWYEAPARRALRKTHGAYPATPEALANWKSFGPVTTAFLDGEGVAAGPTAAPAPAKSAKGRAPVAKRTKAAPRPAPAKASKTGSNWFRGPTKKAAKAPAAEADLEAPPAPAQPAPAKDLEAQPSAAPAPAPSPAPSRSSWFPSRAGKTDIEAGRAQTAGGPAAPVFIVSGKSGARLRAGVELDSPLVADLPSGTIVTVRERATTRDGAERCCVISGDTIGWLSDKLLVAATPPAVVRSIFDGVSDNGQISVMQAWKALRTNDAFARAMGFDGRDGEWDRLVLAFDELREEGKKNISFEEFRRVLLSAGEEADDGPAAVAAGTQSSAMSKLRAAIHASTAFRAIAADAPPPPPKLSGGPPEDLPPPTPSSPSGWFDSNF